MENKRQSAANHLRPVVLLSGCALFVCAAAACGIVAFGLAAGWVFQNANVERSRPAPLPDLSSRNNAGIPSGPRETATVSAPSEAVATVDAKLPGAPQVASPAPHGPTGVLSRTPVPSAALPPSTVVEDWQRFSDSEALSEAISVNEGWADNRVVVSLDTQQQPAVDMLFQITAAAPNDYVGFEWDLDGTQDWRGFDNLAVRLATTDVTSRQLVVQFHERSGEVWRHRMALADVVDLPEEGPLGTIVRIPLAPSAWEWADWSESRNLEMDLAEVTGLGLFVGHTGPGVGAVVFGAISVERR